MGRTAIARDSGLTVEVGGTAPATGPAAGSTAEAIGMGAAAAALLCVESEALTRKGPCDPSTVEPMAHASAPV